MARVSVSKEEKGKSQELLRRGHNALTASTKQNVKSAIKCARKS